MWRGASDSSRKDIVFTGVGKSSAELECAVPLGLKAINVESAGELARDRSDRRALGPTRLASPSA